MWIRSAVAAMLLAATPVQAPPAGPDEVYAALGVDRVASDYVVMVDVSGSMRGARYQQLRRSLIGFFAALAPEDRVTLVPFDERAKAVTRQVGREPGQLAAGLPRDAVGAYTDIGAALEAGVTALARPDAPPLATVVLLTDGRHDPGPRSAYPLTQGHNWNQLADRAAKLNKVSLQAYAIPLSGATGATLLRKVFPGASVLAPTSVDRLTARLARPKAEARAAKARSLLAAEVTEPVRVTWPAEPIGAGRTTVEVRVENPMPHVPLVLNDLAVAGAEVAPGPVELPPGGGVTVPVTVDWDPGPRSLAPLRTVTAQRDLQLTARVDSPWSAVLTGELGLTLAGAPAAAPGTREFSAQRGSLWWWVTTAVLLAALTVVLVRWRRSRLSPPLTGAVTIRRGGGEQRVLPLSGRRVVLSADATGLPGSGEITAARSGVGSSDVQLMISYSPDGSAGSRGSAACPPGGTVSVAGTSFSWDHHNR
ncbi:VWA domain-containing protein [Actinoplanes hulinensis]|uniref:VWA domain-containing protein n=1 Tax=Actinoplanes hulinensis TaxID=1144547 RepID=A0ABS7B618_9ACTN|nr:vWA domain-containing protein [Actinoplanes hulinensis]MBW6436451.1 VWA domain-containing protein [Actinoplanes hulinensis]